MHAACQHGVALLGRAVPPTSPFSPTQVTYSGAEAMRLAWEGFGAFSGEVSTGAARLWAMTQGKRGGEPWAFQRLPAPPPRSELTPPDPPAYRPSR